jgi:hypothetical protein
MTAIRASSLPRPYRRRMEARLYRFPIRAVQPMGFLAPWAPWTDDRQAFALKGIIIGLLLLAVALLEVPH